MLEVVALDMSFGTNDLTQVWAVFSMFPGAAFMCTQADDFGTHFVRASIFLFTFLPSKTQKSSMVVDGKKVNRNILALTILVPIS
jgi:hypothetical protein